jgi:phosphocarrier protein HPr
MGNSEEKKITVTITNPLGFHARPAAEFVKCASKFGGCKVFVERDGVRVNGKSIMGLMLFAAEEGSQMDIIVTGENADACLKALENLVKDNFGEYLQE